MKYKVICNLISWDWDKYPQSTTFGMEEKDESKVFEELEKIYGIKPSKIKTITFVEDRWEESFNSSPKDDIDRMVDFIAEEGFTPLSYYSSNI